VVWGRTPEVLRSAVDGAPRVPRYHPGAAPVYRESGYRGQHASMYNKGGAYAVEAVNAETRHYPARLGRRPRRISRRIRALRRAADLPARCYNAGQPRQRKYQQYPAPLTAPI
jgi:hypothetical protein